MKCNENVTIFFVRCVPSALLEYKELKASEV